MTTLSSTTSFFIVLPLAAGGVPFFNLSYTCCSMTVTGLRVDFAKHKRGFPASTAETTISFISSLTTRKYLRPAPR
jgi:hypothetical protein